MMPRRQPPCNAVATHLRALPEAEAEAEAEAGNESGDDAGSWEAMSEFEGCLLTGTMAAPGGAERGESGCLLPVLSLCLSALLCLALSGSVWLSVFYMPLSSPSIRFCLCVTT